MQYRPNRFQLERVNQTEIALALGTIYYKFDEPALTAAIRERK
ncbi:hypothetical protein EST38_g12342 [Candolleomyces aberdarensis]|uniref:Uncharacterized protein n=1 Tax=Candolleomyces aberdarensis TaxID=2316362 RepID=A0A4Q2D590_9AGAR|nr:hypothetical protein EST38_g12342 [Candolleomyces aberdarensis]